MTKLKGLPCLDLEIYTHTSYYNYRSYYPSLQIVPNFITIRGLPTEIQASELCLTWYPTLKTKVKLFKKIVFYFIFFF